MLKFQVKLDENRNKSNRIIRRHFSRARKSEKEYEKEKKQRRHRDQSIRSFHIN